MAQNRQGGDDLKILVRKDSGTQQLTDKDGFNSIEECLKDRRPGWCKIVLIYLILKQCDVM